MFVISGHPHIRQLTVWTDLPPPSFLRLKIMSENAFRNNIFYAYHISRHFSVIFFLCVIFTINIMFLIKIINLITK